MSSTRITDNKLLQHILNCKPFIHIILMRWHIQGQQKKTEEDDDHDD